MATREFQFEVHYGGKINRGFTCAYIGGKVDMYDEKFNKDKLSFFEIEGIVKKYGYKSGDLVYYIHPGCSIQSGLKLISLDYNVLEMVAAHVEVPVIMLYLVSFDESRVNDDEYEDYNDDNDGEYGENSRIDRDDPYWEEMLEPDLFDEDNNLSGPSMEGGIVEEGGVEGGVEGDEDGNDGEDAKEDNDDEEKSNEEAEGDNQNANAERAIIQVSERGECYGDEIDDDANSDMAQSDILVSPPISDEENEVESLATCVTRRI
jgi:hypothetical protein